MHYDATTDDLARAIYDITERRDSSAPTSAEKRALSLAITKLEEACMWLGKAQHS